MDTKLNKNLIISFDGLGLSTSWGKNCIKSANMTNFNELWHEYPHIVVENKSGSLPDIDQLVFYDEGQKRDETIKYELSKERVGENLSIKQIFQTSKDKHSNINLILYINESNFIHQKDLLSTILKNTDFGNISTTSVVLVFDQKFENDILKITLLDFERIINSNKAFLSCIISNKLLSTDVDIAKFIGVMTKTSNDGYFSLTQYFSRTKNDIDFARLVNDYSKTVPYSDFDQILIVNTEAETNNLAKSLSSLSVTSVFPKFIKIYSLLWDKYFENCNIVSIIKIDQNDFVNILLSNGRKVGILCDQDDSRLYQRYKNIAAVYPKNSDKIFKDVLRFVENGNSDTVFLTISSCRELIVSSFDDTVNFLKLFDQFLLELSKLLDKGVSIIMFSPSAFLDKVNIDFMSHKIIPDIYQKTPFIIANSSYPKINKTDLLSELISKNKSASISNIVPSILKYLNIRSDKSQIDKSVLSKMR